MLQRGVERYSRGAILLHWIIAVALAVELAIGFGMPGDASGFALFQLHKSLGITILLLTLVRIGWRLTHKAPPAVEGGINGFLARAVHFGFYAFMLAAPLTGWAVVSTSPIDIPTLLFGVVPWPHLPLEQALNHTLEEAHELLAFFGIGLFLLHVAGALKHHLLVRDGVMARMSPGGSAKAGLALLAIVVLAGAGTFAMMPTGAEHDHETDHAAEAGAAPADTSAADPAALVTDEADPALAEEELTEEEIAAAAVAGPPPAWDIQPGGSLHFMADNGGTMLHGSFRRWSGSITMDPENTAGANIRIEIDLASASLGDATQDTMLASGDFFGVSANPVAVFRSTSVTKTGANAYRANGTLSLKGASRAQTINFTLSGSGATRSVSGSGTVDRTAFGVGTGDNAAGLAPSVRVEFTFDAARN